MNKSVLLVIILLALVVLGGGWFAMNMNKPETVVRTEVGAQEEVMATTELTAEPEMDMTGEVKEFVVEGSNFKYSLSEIRVKKGEMVRIVYKNISGFHDWVVDDFNAKTNQLKDGEEETIEFVADKVGTFEYYCSVGQHRKMGMVGKLVVE